VDLNGALSFYTPLAGLIAATLLVITAYTKGWVVSSTAHQNELRQANEFRIAEVAQQKQISELWKSAFEEEQKTARVALNGLANLTNELRGYNQAQRTGNAK